MPDLDGGLPSLIELIPAERISLDAEASNWREAIRLSGKLFLETGIIEPRYIEAMIRIAEELGPYIVIAPHIALPHARPEDGALETGLCLVKLKPPIAFGHADHDPVELLFGLVAVDKEVHVRALQTLAEVLSESHFVEELKAAVSVEEIHTIFSKAEELADE
jgi:mannitol/fructose-specific phosphotransferase system IIA component (Ntr-type)